MSQEQPKIPDLILGKRPPQDGKQYDCQCARCGSSMDWHRCDNCEDGYDGHDCGEDCCCCAFPEENVICQYCEGQEGWYRCLSSSEFCKENPLPGRETIERGNIEWFLDEWPED